MSDLISIEKHETDELIVKLENYADEIESSFNDMSSLILDIKNSINGAISDTIQNKFSEFENQFGLINDDMKAYIQDFKKLIVDFEDEDSSVSTGEVDKAKEGGEIINVKH